MKSRIRFHLRERLKRIHYISVELPNLVGKSIVTNQYAPHSNSYAAMLINQHQHKQNAFISKHRIWCLKNSSPKIVNKDYRMSRFELNQAARKNQIAGLLKTGW